MHLLYLDDSGSPGNTDEEYFVLGGVCVPETSVRWLANEIEQLAAHYDPTAPTALEFHAAEIFRGTNPPWKNITRPDRSEAIKTVLHCLDKAYPDTVIFACAIHKKSYPHEDLVICAYEDIASRFDMFLQRRSTDSPTAQRGIIILDKSSYETGLQTLSGQIRRTGNRWGSWNRNIIEIPMFVDSRASRIVQLADHIAYSVFRRYSAGDTNYFDVIQGRFDQREGEICGLAHKQKINRNCTCPACITRR